MTLEQRYLEEAAGLKEPERFAGRRKLGWRSPSNIALVKYWGKRPVQIPENPSLSFTLSSSHTDTRLEYALQDSGRLKMDFLFEGKVNPAFEKRVRGYLESMVSYLPFLEKLELNISSSNSFPHSSGIASSASAMSAPPPTGTSSCARQPSWPVSVPAAPPGRSMVVLCSGVPRRRWKGAPRRPGSPGSAEHNLPSMTSGMPSWLPVQGRRRSAVRMATG